ncbi:MAG TPA: PilZ domain-containing protein [Candidatus Acidoferrum sp.]|nr:PilZ domain-containing protein [Candidatus Acidoferrum sp.]
MRHEHHRAPRYPFLATLELTDVESEKQLTARTRDLNLFGCFAESAETFLADTKVRLRIVRGGAAVSVVGKVAYARPGSGMGIQFITIDPNGLRTLEEWVENLRK